MKDELPDRKKNAKSIFSKSTRSFRGSRNVVVRARWTVDVIAEANDIKPGAGEDGRWEWQVELRLAISSIDSLFLSSTFNYSLSSAAPRSTTTQADRYPFRPSRRPSFSRCFRASLSARFKRFSCLFFCSSRWVPTSWRLSCTSFHSPYALLIPNAAIPIAAVSWMRALLRSRRASCGVISPLANSSWRLSRASMLE